MGAYIKGGQSGDSPLRTVSLPEFDSVYRPKLATDGPVFGDGSRAAQTTAPNSARIRNDTELGFNKHEEKKIGSFLRPLHAFPFS